MMNPQWLIPALVVALSTPAIAAEKTKLEEHSQTYSVGLGATRLIYQMPSRGAMLSVNNPNDYPVLVQSAVTTEDGSVDSPFTVTPPLFRLDAQQKSSVRVLMTKDIALSDTEKLYWFCATGIPPEADDVWIDGQVVKSDVATLNVRVKMKQCIKLFVRPPALKHGPQDSAGSVTWQWDGNALVGKNATPFYVNLKSLSVGGTEIASPEFIPPQGTQRYTLKTGHTASMPIKWQVINDIGGVSKMYTGQVR